MRIERLRPMCVISGSERFSISWDAVRLPARGARRNFPEVRKMAHFLKYIGCFLYLLQNITNTAI
jgi:hypothetical protein